MTRTSRVDVSSTRAEVHHDIARTRQGVLVYAHSVQTHVATQGGPVHTLVRSRWAGKKNTSSSDFTVHSSTRPAIRSTFTRACLVHTRIRERGRCATFPVGGVVGLLQRSSSNSTINRENQRVPVNQILPPRQP